jgi:hypothetical protein
MSTQPVAVLTERAKRYIDDVIRISHDYGMRTDPSDDAYTAAVASASAAFSWTTTQMAQQSR